MYFQKEKKCLLIEVLCESLCRFEGVAGLQSLSRDYAKHDLNRHLRGRFAQDRGFAHTLSSQEEVRFTAGFVHLHGSSFASLRLGCLRS